MVLYLTSEFVSSPKGSSLFWDPGVGGTACFSGSPCPLAPLSMEGLSVTLSSLSGGSSVGSLVAIVGVEWVVVKIVGCEERWQDGDGECYR